MGYTVLTRRRNRRRAVLMITVVAAVAAVGTLWWKREHRPEVPPVPTVAVVNTAVDIECVDDAGATNAAAKYWYTYKADGALNLDGEITSSLRLGNYASIVFAAVADNIGSYATTAIRDVAPDPAMCPTDRIAEVKFADGGEVVVTAWRSIAAASPQWIPSEVPFTQTDDTTFVSDGPHVVTVLKVAPDGTSVAVTAFGQNARQAYIRNHGVLPEATVAAPMGPAPATVAQLTPIADAAMTFSLAR